MDSTRPTFVTYLTLAAIGLPVLGAIISPGGLSDKPAPLPLISVLVFGYVPFSDRAKSAPIIATEVDLYDMFASFSDDPLIHISEGGNNLPGGGGLTYGADEWEERVELAIKNAKTVIFQPFSTDAMYFELDAIRRLRSIEDAVFFFPVFSTIVETRGLLGRKEKDYHLLKFYYDEDLQSEIADIARSIGSFCKNAGLDLPEDLIFPSLVRYSNAGEISEVLHIFEPEAELRKFMSGWKS